MKEMEESLLSKVDLIKSYIQNGEMDQSRKQAEDVIRNQPEDYPGYVLMAYHYYLLKQPDDVVIWINEALRRAPEDEDVLTLAVMIYDDLQIEESKRKELIEIGLRLFPQSHELHAQYALLRSITREQGLAALQEAIRLSPQNEEYLRYYSFAMLNIGNMEEAEKYERLALQANPENTDNLLEFAWAAYERKKYKKAQMLIEEAMRLQPNDLTIREYYKKIYPTKNEFIRAKREMLLVLQKIWVAPVHFIARLSKNKIPLSLLAAIVLLLELAGSYALLGNSLFIITGVFFLFLFICSKIAKSTLKKAGFTESEEAEMQKKTKAMQKTALKEMRKELANHQEQPIGTQAPLSADELEIKLSEIWDSADIDSIKEKTVVKDAALQPQPAIRKTETTMVWPKEYRKWPVYCVMLGIVLSSVVRFIPSMIDDDNRPQAVSQEMTESIHVVQEQQKQDKDITIIKDNMPAVTQFIQSLKDDSLTETMGEFVSENYKPALQENINHPLLQQLDHAKIDKVSNQKLGLAISYFLLVNEEENVKAIVQAAGGQITHLYSETWSQSTEEKENYQKLMNQLEVDGKDFKEIVE